MGLGTLGLTFGYREFDPDLGLGFGLGDSDLMFAIWGPVFGLRIQIYGLLKWRGLENWFEFASGLGWDAVLFWDCTLDG